MRNSSNNKTRNQQPHSNGHSSNISYHSNKHNKNTTNLSYTKQLQQQEQQIAGNNNNNTREHVQKQHLVRHHHNDPNLIARRHHHEQKQKRRQQRIRARVTTASPVVATTNTLSATSYALGLTTMLPSVASMATTSSTSSIKATQTAFYVAKSAINTTSTYKQSTLATKSATDAAATNINMVNKHKERKRKSERPHKKHSQYKQRLLQKSTATKVTPMLNDDSAEKPLLQAKTPALALLKWAPSTITAVNTTTTTTTIDDDPMSSGNWWGNFSDEFNYTNNSDYGSNEWLSLEPSPSSALLLTYDANDVASSAATTNYDEAKLYTATIDKLYAPSTSTLKTSTLDTEKVTHDAILSSTATIDAENSNYDSTLLTSATPILLLSSQFADENLPTTIETKVSTTNTVSVGAEYVDSATTTSSFDGDVSNTTNDFFNPDGSTTNDELSTSNGAFENLSSFVTDFNNDNSTQSVVNLQENLVGEDVTTPIENYVAAIKTQNAPTQATFLLKQSSTRTAASKTTVVDDNDAMTEFTKITQQHHHQNKIAGFLDRKTYQRSNSNNNRKFLRKFATAAMRRQPTTTVTSRISPRKTTRHLDLTTTAVVFHDDDNNKENLDNTNKTFSRIKSVSGKKLLMPPVVTASTAATTKKTVRKSTQRLLATPFHQLITYVRNDAGEIDIDNIDNISVYTDLLDVDDLSLGADTSSSSTERDERIHDYSRIRASATGDGHRRLAIVSGYLPTSSSIKLPESIQIAKIKINRERQRLRRQRRRHGSNA